MMFEALSDRIKVDEAAPAKERILKGALIALLSVVLFAALYFAVRWTAY